MSYYNKADYTEAWKKALDTHVQAKYGDKEREINHYLEQSDPGQGQIDKMNLAEGQVVIRLAPWMIRLWLSKNKEKRCTTTRRKAILQREARLIVFSWIDLDDWKD